MRAFWASNFEIASLDHTGVYLWEGRIASSARILLHCSRCSLVCLPWLQRAAQFCGLSAAMTTNGDLEPTQPTKCVRHANYVGIYLNGTLIEHSVYQQGHLGKKLRSLSGTRRWDSKQKPPLVIQSSELQQYNRANSKTGEVRQSSFVNNVAQQTLRNCQKITSKINDENKMADQFFFLPEVRFHELIIMSQLISDNLRNFNIQGHVFIN